MTTPSKEEKITNEMADQKAQEHFHNPMLMGIRIIQLETELADTRRALELCIAVFWHYEVGRQHAMKRFMESARKERG